jgi:tetratricopeptide (TPR) repeat protein
MTAPELARLRALLARGDLLEGEEAGSALLQKASGNEELHFALGHMLVRHFMPRLALPHLQRAAARLPANDDVQRIYGGALLDAGELREARRVLEATVLRNADNPRAYRLLARLNASCDRREDAAACFRKAIARSSGQHRNDLENQLLDLRLSWGNFDAIADELEAVIDDGTATPHQLAIYIRLRAPTEANAAAALLEAHLASDALTAEGRIELLHARALILEKAGRYAEAFDTLSKAKATKRSDYFAEDFEAYVSRMVTVMTRDAVNALAAKIGDPDFRPVFIAGVPRSGTTLTEQILSSHSKVGGAGEAGSLGEMLRLLSRSGVGHGDSLEVTMRRAGLDRIARLRDGIRAALRNRTGDATVVVDKTPQNFMTIHLILTLFPQARIVHCFRNPADNFMSAFRLDMTPEHGYAHSPQSFARFYSCYARLMRHWYREFPERIFALDYDVLVTAPESHIRQLLAFLGLPWEAACLTPQQNAARVTTPSMFQVRQPINAKSVGSSRPYAAQIGNVFLPEDDFALRDKAS